MPEAVIVEALRTPIGRGKPIVGALSGFHPTHLLGRIVDGVIERAGIDTNDVEQLIGGCVTQAGEQAGNVARNALLARGKGWKTGATTIDTQCGSGQQANHLIRALIAAGSIDVGVAGGVEVMSHVGLGMNVVNGPGYFTPGDWPWDSPFTQFEAAQRIADNRGITREDTDRLGLRSQQLAAAARDAGHFDREILPLDAPVVDAQGNVTAGTRRVTTDQGIRESSLEKLAALPPAHPDFPVHSAGNSSQVSDEPAAVLWMNRDKAESLGLAPRARIVQDVVVGTDPYYLLDGPIDATNAVLARAGMTLADIDLYEVNEAFASVVLSWQRVFDADMDKLNVNGGAIALGHPVGATGARLIATALHELERRGLSTALVTMCCGASVGTATIIERV